MQSANIIKKKKLVMVKKTLE